MFRKILVIVSILILAPVINAQEIKNPTAVGPQVSWHKAADADNGHFMYGAALKLKLTNALGFEGSINLPSGRLPQWFNKYHSVARSFIRIILCNS